MDILYRSTRGHNEPVKASQAILQGLAVDGGLFVPDRLPVLDVPVASLAGKDYREIAYIVMKQFLTDFTEEELKACIAGAYDDKFDTKELVPVVKVDGAYHLELFHGATIAFKDMALSILPHFMVTALKKNHVDKEIVILTATSGDTGKAALAGFANVPGTRIIVFYPKDGVSKIQELQMVTQKGDNTAVVGIKGNFDDAQTGVKEIFSDKAMGEKIASAGFQFSSANSINIGRLVPQVVYYVYAYAKLLERGEIADGEKINVVVPTGNFGNILAAFYAKNMGIPIGKLICASNENKVLFDFFETGVYDKNREFKLTSSPSMDILVSSNLERLIYKIVGGDADKCAALMQALKTNGKYEIGASEKAELSDFVGGYATEEQTAQRIREVYEKEGYIMDTHTAVASYVYDNYRKTTGDNTKTVLASTASPYKFLTAVLSAIDELPAEIADDEFAKVDKLNAVSHVAVPKAVEELRSAPVLHKRVCASDAMAAEVLDILNIK
ncbi:MAG: threonine synthase [Lachnospiraceae bacterium]|nr:threonine synthase [Lachnospiraceae bacterium]